MDPPLRVNSELTDVSHSLLNKPLLQRGSRGVAVVELLKLLAHWQIPVNPTHLSFDQELETAVRSFQRQLFLPESGRVDPLTWRALYTGTPLNMPEVQRGNCGRAIRLLQQVLQSTGDYHGEVNGQFDRLTHQAVCQFQRRRGLVMDGIVGACTWHALSKVSR